MKKQWGNHGNIFQLAEVSSNVDLLPKAIYKTQFNPMSGQLYLEQMQLEFEFPYKIYGMEDGFINHVIKTYDNTTGNLGILLNGVKGTGKTVTAQMLCNKLNLPVIIVQAKYEGNLLPNFINDIQQDVVIFFDEYEKMYQHYDYSILTVMDGVLNNNFRKTFLLTTNTSSVNENMLSRPSRIRYCKTFGDLTLNQIIEIVEDKLLITKFKKEVIDFISNLEIITVDIVKSLVEEVNIHNMPPMEFKNIFNIASSTLICNVYHVENGESKIFRKSVMSIPKVFKDDWTKDINPNIEGNDLYLSGEFIGNILAVIEDRIIVNQVIYNEDDDTETTKKIELTFENANKKNNIFKNYSNIL